MTKQLKHCTNIHPSTCNDGSSIINNSNMILTSSSDSSSTVSDFSTNNAQILDGSEPSILGDFDLVTETVIVSPFEYNSNNLDNSVVSNVNDDDESASNVRQETTLVDVVISTTQTTSPQQPTRNTVGISSSHDELDRSIEMETTKLSSYRSGVFRFKPNHETNDSTSSSTKTSTHNKEVENHKKNDKEDSFEQDEEESGIIETSIIPPTLELQSYFRPMSSIPGAFRADRNGIVPQPRHKNTTTTRSGQPLDQQNLSERESDGLFRSSLLYRNALHNSYDYDSGFSEAASSTIESMNSYTQYDEEVVGEHNTEAYYSSDIYDPNNQSYGDDCEKSIANRTNLSTSTSYRPTFGNNDPTRNIHRPDLQIQLHRHSNHIRQGSGEDNNIPHRSDDHRRTRREGGWTVHEHWGRRFRRNSRTRMSSSTTFSQDFDHDSASTTSNGSEVLVSAVLVDSQGNVLDTNNNPIISSHPVTCNTEAYASNHEHAICCHTNITNHVDHVTPGGLDSTSSSDASSLDGVMRRSSVVFATPINVTRRNLLFTFVLAVAIISTLGWTLSRYLSPNASVPVVPLTNQSTFSSEDLEEPKYNASHAPTESPTADSDLGTLVSSHVVFWGYTGVVTESLLQSSSSCPFAKNSHKEKTGTQQLRLRQHYDLKLSCAGGTIDLEDVNGSACIKINNELRCSLLKNMTTLSRFVDRNTRTSASQSPSVDSPTSTILFTCSGLVPIMRSAIATLIDLRVNVSAQDCNNNSTNIDVSRNPESNGLGNSHNKLQKHPESTSPSSFSVTGQASDEAAVAAYVSLGRFCYEENKGFDRENISVEKEWKIWTELYPCDGSEKIFLHQSGVIYNITDVTDLENWEDAVQEVYLDELVQLFQGYPNQSQKHLGQTTQVKDGSLFDRIFHRRRLTTKLTGKTIARRHQLSSVRTQRKRRPFRASDNIDNSDNIMELMNSLGQGQLPLNSLEDMNVQRFCFRKADCRAFSSKNSSGEESGTSVKSSSTVTCSFNLPLMSTSNNDERPSCSYHFRRRPSLETQHTLIANTENVQNGIITALQAIL